MPRSHVGARLFSAAIGLASLAASTAAHADWRYTRWGMSPEEVRAAGGEQVVPRSKNRPLPLSIKAPFEIGGVKFEETVFQFKDNKLSQVVLMSVGLSEPQLRQSLSASFGQAASRDRNSIGSVPTSVDVYQDKEKGNSIKLQCVMANCSVIYSPLDQGF